MMKKNYKNILTKEFLIKHYLDLKKSIKTIADEIKCSFTAIRYNLIKNNIKIRTSSEAAKNKPPMTEITKQKLSEIQKGENNHNFKLRIKNNQGYIFIYDFNHPYRNSRNRVREQRWVVEKKIGRFLDPKWAVHHIDGIKYNNDVKNLICFSSESAHQRFHHNPKNVKKNEIIFDGRKIK